MAIKPIELLIRARDEASGVLGSVQTRLMGLVALITTYFGITAFVGMVKGAGDLEQALDRVQAATGATKDEMVLLRNAAEESGVDSILAAGALENLAKAGLSVKDAIATLPSVMSLAQAGDVSLAESSEYLTKIVMGMGLAFSDAGRVADVLAMGANATNTSVKGLADGLSYAAPLAQSLDLSLESTVAILGKFADAGIDASRAGTALNSIMAQFGDPASKFRQELGAAGIITNNFETALHQLAKAGPGGSKAINAVGQEAGPALRALLNQGMGALDELTAKLRGAEGSAAATAKVMQGNLNSALSDLQVAWKYVTDTLGTPVLPVLKDGIDQLTGALRGAVTDGTIGKFGDAIAVSFQSGIKWARDFLAQIDFTQVSADLRAFADRTGEVFTQIGEYASVSGNSAKLAYGVMSTGANTVMAIIYLLAEAFSGVASDIQSSLAFMLDSLAKVSFGGLSASFKQAAEEVRLSAGATWAASEEFAKKSEKSFADAAKGAEIASAGWDGLTASSAQASRQASASEGVFKQVAETLKAVGDDATATGQKATAGADKQKLAADTARAAVAQLKTEYEAALAAGNVQLALEKMQAMQAALKSTASQAQLTAEDIAAAFQRMGITSTADLKLQADAAKRDYEIIKGAATSTAADISNAFKKSADDAIKANNGVAPSWVTAEAAARGYEVQVDSAGKATLRAAGEAAKSVDVLADAYTRAGQAAQSSADSAVSALERQNAEVERLNAALEKSAELERKRRNIDKDGFTTGADGQRIVAGTDLGTLTGVAAFLKAAGVDDDKAARKLALEFSDGKGNIDYLGNVGQKKYGGDTLSMSLLKAAETYTFGSDKNGSNAKTPSTIPTPAAPAATYITNITLPSGGGTKAVRTQDADSQAIVNDLVRQLALARGTAS